MTWLLISQSFFVATYARLITSNSLFLDKLEIMRWALPFLGLITSLSVAFSICAADQVLNDLCDTRANITEYLNKKLPIYLSALSSSDRKGKLKYTALFGAIPHKIIPYFLALFWVLLIIL